MCFLTNWTTLVNSYVLTENFVSNVLSFFAILISIFVAIYNWFQNKKINKSNIEANMLLDVYKEYIITEIPNARVYMHYYNENLGNIDELVDVLRNIRKKSLFFKYKDENFYLKLTNKLLLLEDMLINNEGKLSNDDFCKFESDLDKQISDIYDLILTKISNI